MVKTKLFRTVYGLGLALIVAMMAALGTQVAHAQEIPNGNGDLLWERSLIVDGISRTVNDAKFHPINGNIIAAVNHEIWEIDPKDGHTIRVFEGETGIKYDGWIDLSTDGNYIILSNGGGTNLKLYDYNKGKLSKELLMKPWSNVDFFPNSTKILFHQSKNIIIYDALSDSIIKKSDSLPYNTYFQYSRLSEDGRLIALGIVTDNFGDRTFTMELWDAETLTKIKDFGEAKVGGFRDIKISNNNQFIGTIGDNNMMNLFQINNDNPVKIFDKIPAFCFSMDNRKMIIYNSLGLGKSNRQILDLLKFDSLYQYNGAGGKLIFSNENKLFSTSFDTSLGAKIQLFSNKWYEVGVANPIKIEIKINNTTYKNNSLEIYTEGIDFINTLLVTDTLGKKIYVQNEVPVINNQTEIPLFLSSGNYLLKIVSNGKEYTRKFIVTR